MFIEFDITKVPTTVCKIGNIVVVTVCGTMKQSLGAWDILDLSYTVPQANARYNAHLFSQDTTDPRILLSVTGTHLFIESKGATVTGWTFGQLVYACKQRLINKYHSVINSKSTITITRQCNNQLAILRIIRNAKGGYIIGFSISVHNQYVIF